MKNSFKQENLKSLFRNSSPNLLERYFETQSLFNDVNLEKEKNKRKVDGFINFLIEEIEKIESQSKRNQVKSDLHKIYLMRDGKNILECIRDGGLKGNLIDEILQVIAYNLFNVSPNKYREIWKNNATPELKANGAVRIK